MQTGDLSHMQAVHDTLLALIKAAVIYGKVYRYHEHTGSGTEDTAAHIAGHLQTLSMAAWSFIFALHSFIESGKR